MELMQWEQDVIVNSMLRKSSKTIAAVLGIDEPSVARFIREHSVGIITKDHKISEKKICRPVKLKKKKEPVITSTRSIHSPIKRQQKKYADRELLFEKLIPIRIDHKTYIYVKPGCDIEKTKRDFLKNTTTNIKSKNLIMTDFKIIPLSEIKPDPNQPRKYYDELAMQELTQSVKEKGILQPILLRPNGKGYILVCGERRYKAATAAGLTEIPAVIRKLSDDEALELQIIENLQRKDVHPMEEAVAFKSLLEKGKDLKEVAARVGKSEYYARQRVKLCSLSKDWQQVFYANRISVTDALKVAFFDDKIQKELFEEEADGARNIELDSWTLKKYLGDLNDASFDLSDTTLDKKMGACTGCKFNTATAALFEDATLAPRCMNVACFKNKTETHFNKAFAAALENPEIIFVHDSWGTSSDKFVVKAQNAGHVVYSSSQYDKVNKPEIETLEEWKEDNDDEDDSYEDYLKDYQKDLAEYNMKILGGKYKPAFLLTGRDRGKTIYIKVTGKGATTSSSKQTKEKEVAGALTFADIDEEIIRLKDREKRAKELDEEKVRDIVNNILVKSDKFTANNRDHNLTNNEITAAAIALFEAGSYDFKKWFAKNFETDGYNIKPKQLDNLNLTYFGLNEIIFHFIKDKLITNYGSRLTSAKVFCIHNIAAEYHPHEVSTAVLDQQTKAANREERVKKRIDELNNQKKLLQENPAKKTSSKK